MPTPKELNSYFDIAVPYSCGFEGDSGGITLLADNENTNVIVLALDVTSDALELAHKSNAGILVTHHPLIFGKIGSVSFEDSVGKRLLKAAQLKINLLAYHTRLDNVAGGVNDVLCATVGVKNTFEFAPCARLGEIENAVSPEKFGKSAAAALKSDRVKVFNHNNTCKRIAVCSGSGGDIVKDAYLAGADTVFTGEAKYNYELDAAEYGINLIMAGHKETEQIVLPALKDIILKGFPSVEVLIYNA